MHASLHTAHEPKRFHDTVLAIHKPWLHSSRVYKSSTRCGGCEHTYTNAIGTPIQRGHSRTVVGVVGELREVVVQRGDAWYLHLQVRNGVAQVDTSCS